MPDNNDRDGSGNGLNGQRPEDGMDFNGAAEDSIESWEDEFDPFSDITDTICFFAAHEEDPFGAMDALNQEISNTSAADIEKLERALLLGFIAKLTDGISDLEIATPDYIDPMPICEKNFGEAREYLDKILGFDEDDVNSVLNIIRTMRNLEGHACITDSWHFLVHHYADKFAPDSPEFASLALECLYDSSEPYIDILAKIDEGYMPNAPEYAIQKYRTLCLLHLYRIDDAMDAQRRAMSSVDDTAYEPEKKFKLRGNMSVDFCDKALEIAKYLADTKEHPQSALAYARFADNCVRIAKSCYSQTDKASVLGRACDHKLTQIERLKDRITDQDGPKDPAND